MQNFVVIGGSTGIGRALSEQLANEGHRVFATYNQTEVQNTVQNVSYHSLNVLNPEMDFSFLPETIDGLAYCPGSINLKPFHRIKPEAFLEDFQLQVIGAIKVLQECLPKMKTSDASVVLFSTVAVQMGYNFHSQVSTSKGAIEGLTRALAAEWAPKIRVNCIAPSLTDTPLASKLLSSDEKRIANADRHPLKKIGSPEDIAEMATFLLTSKSSWMTGQILHIDGGMSSVRL